MSGFTATIMIATLMTYQARPGSLNDAWSGLPRVVETIWQAAEEDGRAGFKPDLQRNEILPARPLYFDAPPIGRSPIRR